MIEPKKNNADTIRTYTLDSKSIVLTFHTVAVDAKEAFDNLLALLVKEKIDASEIRQNNLASDVEGLEDETWLITLKPGTGDDFTDSDEFYKYCSGKKSKFKIVSDEFSFSRGSKLFVPLQKLEMALRETTVRKYPNPTDIPAQHPIVSQKEDHPIAQLDMFTIIEVFLFADCTDKYYKEQLELIFGDEELEPEQLRAEIIRLRRLKLWDEIVGAHFIKGRQTKFKVYPDAAEAKKEWSVIRNVRNATMHHRVITAQDFEVALKLVEKHQKIISEPSIRLRFESVFEEFRNALYGNILNVATSSVSNLNRDLFAAWQEALNPQR